MYEVGVCGHFGIKQNLLNGQTVKTKTLTNELRILLGTEAVQILDTHGWRSNPIALLLNCYLLLKDCKNIVIMPARNGVKVFVPLFLLFNIIFNKELHYIVIGGWLPELVDKNLRLKKKLCKFNGVYVETHSMVRNLEKLGLKNVRYLPNFKRLNILNEHELIYPSSEPYKLCTFSRVSKEKGIEDAIEAVKAINNIFGRCVYTLDIYGQVDEAYRERFQELKITFPHYITYNGNVNFNDSVKVLKDYFALLFPTYYEGEGFPGTIIDAYAAGVPVIATDWKYNAEIIRNKLDGIIYKHQNSKGLQNILYDVQRNPNIIIRMKRNCVVRAKEFSSKIVTGELLTYFK